MKKIVFDLDETICSKKITTYDEVKPIKEIIDKINCLSKQGWYIIIYTARHMVTCGGNVDLVKSRIGNETIDWLKKNNVNYDELIFGKPFADYYVDDKALTPEQFLLKQF